jgi:hypothetical protein
MKTTFVIAIMAITLSGYRAKAQPTPLQLASFDAGQLSAINVDQVSPFATCWLRTSLLPVPLYLFRDLACYDLDASGEYLLDDRDQLSNLLGSGPDANDSLTPQYGL